LSWSYYAWKQSSQFFLPLIIFFVRVEELEVGGAELASPDEGKYGDVVVVFAKEMRANLFADPRSVQSSARIDTAVEGDQEIDREARSQYKM
jgi:hypothetical protein